MPTDSSFWSNHYRANISCYSESLLRQVVGNLLKPRSHWPVEELIERMVENTSNAPAVDRRLKEMPAGCRKLLALIGLSGATEWQAGNLVEMLTALGEADGYACVTTLLESGLLYPDIAPPDGVEQPKNNKRKPARFVDSFKDWFNGFGGKPRLVFAHPDVTRRALTENLGLPDLSADETELNTDNKSAREADGLEWFFRLAIIWQQAGVAPFRLTQQREFYKRDLERLQNDPMLGGPPADALLEIANIGSLTTALARCEGILIDRNGDLVAGELPTAWQEDLPAAVCSLWQSVVQLRRGISESDNSTISSSAYPWPGIYLLCMLSLREAPAQRWVETKRLFEWVHEHHPFWRGKSATRRGAFESLGQFLLGVVWQLRLVQAIKTKPGQWLVRLSPLGRWLFGNGQPPITAAFAQTLLVQPNLEILLYRQGATPALIAALSKFAAWKGLSAACNLQLEPEIIYAALENGATLESIQLTLQKHGMKPTPAPVLDSLRTWAQKRERISVYPSAVILEFLKSDELDEALARGVPAVRLSDRLAVVAREKDLQLHHFRLRGNRDYTLPPEPCVEILADGVTLQVDLNKSDLLLESEISRFADALDAAAGLRCFRVSQESLERARMCGMTIDALENWFLVRCNEPLPAAARLLFDSKAADSIRLRRLTVLQVRDIVQADGLLQWSATRELIEERLGPGILSVAEENLPALVEMLQSLGISIEEDSAVDESG